MRDALDLVTNGLISSMEFIASSMVASKHHGRSVVLNHCSELPIAGYKSQLENSDYFALRVFGALPPSTHAVFRQEKHLRGSVRVLPEGLSTPGPCGLWGFQFEEATSESFFSLEGSGCCLRQTVPRWSALSSAEAVSFLVGPKS